MSSSSPDSPNPAHPEREISRQPLGQGKFLTLSRIHWRDAQGHERDWESVDRVGQVSAVLIIAWLTPSDRLLLIQQYRPPTNAQVIEFPAGLIDAGETPEQAATRELLEETGYTLRIDAIAPPAFNSPGMTGESVHIVVGEIDEHAPENASVIPHFDAGEQIATLLIPRADLPHFLLDQHHAGARFDSKVIAYVAGLNFR
jgi:ADP-ribose pyrophosphatase